MHPLSYQVSKLIPRLEFEQFRHLEDRERLNVIRALATEQVRDDNQDTFTQRERYGRSGRVRQPGEMGGYGEDGDLWPQRTRRQLALEVGMEPVLSMVITAEERVLLRQVYDEQPEGGLRTIGARYGVSHVAILKRLRRINKKLREEMLKVYGPKPDDEDGTLLTARRTEEVVDGGELPEEEGS